jgi:hypothetical protein
LELKCKGEKSWKFFSDLNAIGVYISEKMMFLLKLDEDRKKKEKVNEFGIARHSPL